MKTTNEIYAIYSKNPVSQIDIKSNGWGFFSEEISFFLADFFQKKLNNEDKLIFYSYYITNMTLEEISKRFYSDVEINKMLDNDESDRDDNIEIKNISCQALHKKLDNINKMLSHAWQYSDRWRD